jgi:hypothetical protein
LMNIGVGVGVLWGKERGESVSQLSHGEWRGGEASGARKVHTISVSQSEAKRW